MGYLPILYICVNKAVYSGTSGYRRFRLQMLQVTDYANPEIVPWVKNFASGGEQKSSGGGAVAAGPPIS